jgi:quercetin dioxygenase-like cupin family protein
MPFLSTDALDAEEKLPGYLGRFLHGEHMTLTRWSVEAGAAFPEHSHPHEQFSIVLEGEFSLTVDGVTEVLRPGRFALIPPGAVHSGHAVTDCEILDVFSPVREDYR